jgi:hypothetical protein
VSLLDSSGDDSPANGRALVTEEGRNSGELVQLIDRCRARNRSNFMHKRRELLSFGAKERERSIKDIIKI